MFTRLDTLTVYVLTIDGFYCYKLMTMISREISFWVFETKPCPEINLRFNEKGFLKILHFYSMKLRGLNKAFSKRWQLICFNLSCSWLMVSTNWARWYLVCKRIDAAFKPLLSWAWSYSGNLKLKMWSWKQRNAKPCWYSGAPVWIR